MLKIRFLFYKKNYLSLFAKCNLFRWNYCPNLSLINTCQHSYRCYWNFFRIFRRTFKTSALLMGFFPFISSKNEPKITIENLMGRAIKSIENDDLDDALVILHQILEMLAKSFKADEITKVEYEGKRARIFSEISNVYMLRRELDNAAKVLIETMRCCFQADIKPSNPMIIEMSLKLALIYEDQKKYDDCDTGFQFCISNCLIEYERNDLEEEEKENVLALLGMCYSYYSKFLYKTSKYKDALSMVSKSIVQALHVYDKSHPNVINLLNDQAVIYLALNDFTKAAAKFQEAIGVCLEFPQEELMSLLPLLYANLGQAFIQIGDIERAEEMCVNSRKYWRSGYKKRSLQSDELERLVKDCFSRLAGIKSGQRED